MGIFNLKNALGNEKIWNKNKFGHYVHIQLVVILVQDRIRSYVIIHPGRLLVIATTGVRIDSRRDSVNSQFVQFSLDILN